MFRNAINQFEGTWVSLSKQMYTVKSRKFKILGTIGNSLFRAISSLNCRGVYIKILYTKIRIFDCIARSGNPVSVLDIKGM